MNAHRVAGPLANSFGVGYRLWLDALEATDVCDLGSVEVKALPYTDDFSADWIVRVCFTNNAITRRATILESVQLRVRGHAADESS